MYLFFKKKKYCNFMITFVFICPVSYCFLLIGIEISTRKIHSVILIFYNLRKSERLIIDNGHCVHRQFVVLFYPARLEELIAELRHAPGVENSHVTRVEIPHCTYCVLFLADDIE